MLIEASGISKQFGGVEVLSNIDLDLHIEKFMRFLERMGQVNLRLPKFLQVSTAQPVAN